MSEDFVITQAVDWPMLIMVGGTAFVVINGIIFWLIGRVYNLLPKKEDLHTLQQTVNKSIHQLMSDVADRFEAVLERHHKHTEQARDKELHLLREDFKEWRAWHNRNCPVNTSNREWVRRNRISADKSERSV